MSSLFKGAVLLPGGAGGAGGASGVTTPPALFANGVGTPATPLGFLQGQSQQGDALALGGD